MQTISYLSSWKTGSHAFSPYPLLKSDFTVRGLICLLIILALWFKRTRLGPLVIFISIWFSFSLFAATLSGRPYPHYLIQIVPPLSLMTGLVFNRKLKRVDLVLSAAVVLLGIAILRYRFGAYPTLSYYKNFLFFVSGKKNKSEYFSYFDPKVPKIYFLAETIAANTKPSDRIFIWSDEPYLYPLSQRLPAIPYVVAYHVLDLGLLDIAGKQISQAKPRVIVIDKNTKRFPKLESMAQEEYFNIYSLDNFLVFRRRGT